MSEQNPANTVTSAPASPVRTWVKKPYVGGGFTKNVDRESKEEREKKQRMINRQSARRDAIDYFRAQNAPFTEVDLYLLAERFFDWVNKS